MRFYFFCFLVLSLTTLSCQTGNLKVITDIPRNLEEASAAEMFPDSDLIWTIEDSGNKNNVYALNNKGKIVKDIDVSNSKNIDWEDLTTDNKGSLYIGDFGNNSRKRKLFTIYKLSDIDSLNDKTEADLINFSLPKGMKSKDFEAFFHFNNFFYIFSKEDNKGIVIKVPNEIGDQEAQLVSKFSLKGKGNRITSADISQDGKTVALLNHNKVIKLSDFESDSFFKGTIDYLEFNHSSQKEGLCFKSNKKLIINDEYSHFSGGNIYEFILK